MRSTAALALLLICTPASAFELATTATGTPLRWTQTLEYDVHLPDRQRLAGACRRAMDTWSAALGPAQLIEHVASTGAPQSSDGRSTIAILQTWDPMYGVGSRTVGHTARFYDARTGVMSEADILLNGEDFVFDPDTRGAFDLESVVLHEAGHVLGLAHSCGEAGRAHPSCFDVVDVPVGTRSKILAAVMAPTLAPAVERRVLGRDDRAGLAASYGPLAASPAFTVDRAVRPCPGDRLEIHGGGFGSQVAVRLRYGSGDQLALSVLEVSDGVLLADATNVRWEPGATDVIVEDVPLGVYRALVGEALAAPEGCDPAPVRQPPASGCHCATSDPSIAGTLLLSVLALFLWARRASGVAVLLLLVLAAPDADAYRCSRVGIDWGPSLVWTSREVGWVLAGATTDGIDRPDTTQAEIVAGFEMWNSQTCSDLTLRFEGIEGDAKAGFIQGGANSNAVVFVPSGWLYDAAVIAVTTSAFDTRTGEIFDADIELNDTHFDFLVAEDGCRKSDGSMDLRNTVTHEAGHFIGLDHPPVQARYADATMFASAPACEVQKQTLASDDIEGLCDIYPANAPTHQCFPPEGPSFLVVDHDDGFGGCRHVTSRPQPVLHLLMLLVISAVARRRGGSARP